MCRFVWAGWGGGAGAGVMYPCGDAGGLCLGGWCRSLCGHGGSAIDCGFKFVDDIESINLNLVTT